LAFLKVILILLMFMLYVWECWKHGSIRSGNFSFIKSQYCFCWMLTWFDLQY